MERCAKDQYCGAALTDTGNFSSRDDRVGAGADLWKLAVVSCGWQ